MKGIILAGGTGSRLMPLTTAVNKHLLACGDKPMIFYPLEKLIGAGIKDILIVTGTEHMGMVVQTLGSGSRFGASFTYRVQDEAGGIAQALYLAKGFTGKERMCVVLGDNIFQQPLKPLLEEFRVQKRGARIVLKSVLPTDLVRFGVALISDASIKYIIEKPNRGLLDADIKSGFAAQAVTGIYFYDHKVFDIIQDLVPSGRGELEISGVNGEYLRRGALKYSVLDGWWTDAGTFESLSSANDYIRAAPITEAGG